MLSTASFLLAFAAASASAQNVIPIHVGDQGLMFTPPSVTAAVGDVVMFIFSGTPGNHTVSQAAFATPCQQLAGGFDSGFVPHKSADKPGVTPPIWNLTITDVSKPIWFYCKQPMPNPHCLKGMVGSINAPATGNTFGAFKAAAMALTAFPDQTPGTLQGIGASASAPPATQIVSSQLAPPPPPPELLPNQSCECEPYVAPFPQAYTYPGPGATWVQASTPPTDGIIAGNPSAPVVGNGTLVGPSTTDGTMPADAAPVQGAVPATGTDGAPLPVSTDGSVAPVGGAANAGADPNAPVNGTDPTAAAPVDPTAAVNGTDPTAAAPVDPNAAVNGTDPTSAAPVDPTAAVNGTDPTAPVDPTAAANGTDRAAATDPGAATDSGAASALADQAASTTSGSAAKPTNGAVRRSVSAGVLVLVAAVVAVL